MEKLNQLVSRVLEVDKNSLTDDSSPSTVDSWASFNGLMLVVELEKNFGVKFTTEEVVSVTRYKDIKDALKKHRIKEEFLN